jgi:hypothetical protein
MTPPLIATSGDPGFVLKENLGPTGYHSSENDEVEGAATLAKDTKLVLRSGVELTTSLPLCQRSNK